MTSITTKLELDQFIFTVEVTHLINQAPDPTCRDSADDFRGCREIEWHLTYAEEYSADGQCIECGQLPWWLAKLGRDHAERIEAMLWEKIDAKGNDQ